MVDRRPNRPLTPGRAALLAMVRDYQGIAFNRPSLVEIQKLMYFLQEAGQPLRLRYQKGYYGPYADNLCHVLTEMEGQYLSGLGDCTAKVQEAEPIDLLSDGRDAARHVLETTPDLAERVSRVMDLIQGWESPYGLELLASVHWLATHDDRPVHDSTEASDRVAAWTNRKRDMFSARHIALAWDALQDRDWLTGRHAVVQ